MEKIEIVEHAEVKESSVSEVQEGADKHLDTSDASEGMDIEVKFESSSSPQKRGKKRILYLKEQKRKMKQDKYKAAVRD